MKGSLVLKKSSVRTVPYENGLYRFLPDPEPLQLMLLALSATCLIAPTIGPIHINETVFRLSQCLLSGLINSYSNRTFNTP